MNRPGSAATRLEAGSFVTVRPLVPVGLGRIELAGRIAGGRGIHPRRPRRYPSHAVMLVTDGTGSYRGTDARVGLRPGSLVLVRPGEPHWYGPAPGERWGEVFCAFTGPVFDLAWRRGALGATGRVLALDDPAGLAALLELIRVAAPPMTTGMQDAEALQLLAALQRAITPMASHELATGWLARSMQLLGADEDPGDLASVAAAVGLSYETWRRRFREQVGVSPGRYRRDARLRSSATLLAMTSLTVTEVAHRTGFVDDRHLARHFTRVYGVSPGRFRRSSALAGRSADSPCGSPAAGPP